MAVIIWAGLRQLQALQDAIQFNLSGLSLWNVKTNEDLSNWLESQGLSVVQGSAVESPGVNTRAIMISTAVTCAFIDKYGFPLAAMANLRDAPDTSIANIGSERSGAGWQNPANFIITSAFLRTLGALEQFEMDVLKSLFYYRPSGVPRTDQQMTEVSADIVTERPKKQGQKLIYETPAIWTWLRKHAENNVERDKIFSSVFGITTVAPDCNSKSKQDWYENRNAIAHGRMGVEMTLGEYVDVQVFIVKAMKHVAEQCKNRHSLII